MSTLQQSASTVSTQVRTMMPSAIIVMTCHQMQMSAKQYWEGWGMMRLCVCMQLCYINRKLLADGAIEISITTVEQLITKWHWPHYVITLYVFSKEGDHF